MAAISMAEGKSTATTASSLPVRLANKTTVKPITIKASIQARLYTVKAPILRVQATKLKNRLLTGGTPSQYTSAGACQNSKDSGRMSCWVVVPHKLPAVMITPTTVYGYRSEGS